MMKFFFTDPSRGGESGMGRVHGFGTGPLTGRASGASSAATVTAEPETHCHHHCHPTTVGRGFTREKPRSRG